MVKGPHRRFGNGPKICS